MKLTIRKNGKYYQVGYYEKSKWNQVKQLGTAEKVYDMVCELEVIKNSVNQLSEHTKKPTIVNFKDYPKIFKTHQ